MKNAIEISFVVKGFIILLAILSACILLDVCSQEHRKANHYTSPFQND